MAEPSEDGVVPVGFAEKGRDSAAVDAQDSA